MIAWAGRVWAIALMTLKEAVRRRVFTILLLFAVALLSCVLFFPSVNLEGRLRLVEVWSLRATSLFTAIVALFLAGFSLPSDFEQKRIYLLVTKPVSKPVVFLGRYLGYCLLVAVFLLGMGAISVLFLRSVELAGGKDFPPLRAYPRATAERLQNRGGQTMDWDEPHEAILAGEDFALVWSFEGLDRSDFGDDVRAEVRLYLGSPTDKYRSEGGVRIKARTGREERVVAQLRLNTNEEQSFRFPADLVGPDGKLDLVVQATDPDGLVAGRRERVILYLDPTSFELAFARGLGLVFLQSLLVLSLTLAVSTLLSAPLSILLGILLYLVGSAHSYVAEGARDIDRSLEEARISGRAKTPENIPKGILEVSNVLSKAILAVVPDFNRFDFSLWLLKDHAVSAADLARAAVWSIPHAAALALLGVLVMIFKDFG
jgi:hypothetical protein